MVLIRARLQGIAAGIVAGTGLAHVVSQQVKRRGRCARPVLLCRSIIRSFDRSMETKP